MAQWYYEANGKNVGPVSAIDVAEAVLRDVLSIQDYVLSGKDNLWKKIGNVPEIMAIIDKPLGTPVGDDKVARQFRDIYSKDLPIEDTVPVYYNIPVRTLEKMQLLTLGFFSVYWFYKQWVYMIMHSQLRRESVLHGLLRYILFAYMIFVQIERDTRLNAAKRPTFDAKQLAILWYFVIPLISIDPMRFIFPGVIIPVNLIYLYLSSRVLIGVQRYVNEANAMMGRSASTLGFGFYATGIMGAGFVVLIVWMIVSRLL